MPSQTPHVPSYDTHRTLDDPADFARYLNLKAERKRIDAEVRALEPLIYGALTDEDGSTADVLGHRLTVRTRRSYE